MQITAFILLLMGTENYVFASSVATSQVPKAVLVLLGKDLPSSTAAMPGMTTYLW